MDELNKELQQMIGDVAGERPSWEERRRLLRRARKPAFDVFKMPAFVENWRAYCIYLLRASLTELIIASFFLLSFQQSPFVGKFLTGGALALVAWALFMVGYWAAARNWIRTHLNRWMEAPWGSSSEDAPQPDIETAKKLLVQYHGQACPLVCIIGAVLYIAVTLLIAKVVFADVSSFVVPSIIVGCLANLLYFLRIQQLDLVPFLEVHPSLAAQGEILEEFRREKYWSHRVLAWLRKRKGFHQIETSVINQSIQYIVLSMVILYVLGVRLPNSPVQGPLLVQLAVAFVSLGSLNLFLIRMRHRVSSHLGEVFDRSARAFGVFPGIRPIPALPPLPEPIPVIAAATPAVHEVHLPAEVVPSMSGVIVVAGTKATVRPNQGWPLSPNELFKPGTRVYMQ